MKLRTRFFIMLGTFAAGILIALAQQPLAGAGSADPDWCPAAGGRIIWGVISIRCTHCGAFLFRKYFTPYYPYCGKELDWN